MATFYGIVAIFLALCCASIAAFAAKEKTNPDSVDYIAVGFLLTVAVFCLMAGLDWLNLIQEM